MASDEKEAPSGAPNKTVCGGKRGSNVGRAATWFSSVEATTSQSRS